MATLNGTENNDSLNGTEGDDLISGLGGNDTIWGRGGNDSLLGNLGDDRFYGGGGNDLLDGGPRRNVWWSNGSAGDFDTALYDDLTAPVTLNLSNLQVSGTSAGLDTLVSIESVQTTGGADSITGSLAARDPNHIVFQTGINWAGMGGGDTVVQDRVNYSYWMDNLFANYGWSNTAINASASGAVVTVTYGTPSNGKTFWNSNVSQTAGADSLTRVTSLGDTRFADVFSLSGLTDSPYGNAGNYVSITTGDDTITGNGDTVVNISSGSRATSSTGAGVNVTLPGSGTQVWDLTHLSWQHSSTVTTPMGRVTVSKIDDVRATDFNDTLTGGGYDDFESFRGKAGNDSIDGRSGYDRADYLGSNSGVYVDLGAGIARSVDSLDGSIGTDTLRSIEAVRGTAFGDVFDARTYGSSTALNVGNSVFGRSNGNSFEGRSGNDTIYGNGSTRIDYSSAAVGVDVDLLRGSAFALGDLNSEAAKSVGVDSFSGVSRVRGSSLGDKLAGGASGASFGNTAIENFEPGPGNDTIDGRGGADEVVYNAGAWISQRGVVIDMNIANGPQVTEDGYGGQDTLSGIELIVGSDLDDHIKGSLNNAGLFQAAEVLTGSKGNDTLDGGASGYDEAGYTNSPAAITINLADRVAQDGWGTSDTLISIEGIEGSSWNDTITGDGGNNRLDGQGGNDTLDGGAGTDWVEYNNATGAVTVNLGAGSASGAAGTDVLTGFENAQGSIYNDSITGSSADNVLEGLEGNDTLTGGDGADTLLGGEGNDRFYGQAGNDLLDGGPRRNVSWGTGTSGDYDIADYNSLTASVSLNLTTLVISGTTIGSDTLRGIEEVRATKQADTVTGALGLRAINATDAQTGLTWVGLGGGDTFTQSQTPYAYWADSIYVDYAWSGTPVQATATAANVISVAYGAGTMFWYGGAQIAGTDQLTYTSSLGDSKWADRFDLSNFSANMFGTKRVYVGLSSGNDTVIGNGDTTLSLLSSSTSQRSDGSTTGAGVNVTLRGDAETTVDVSGINWQPLSNSTDRVAGGTVKFQGVDEIRGTAFNDTLTGGGYDDYEGFRGRAGDDLIDGGSGYDLSDYLGSTAGVHVVMAEGIAKGTVAGDLSIGTDTLRSIEAIRGTNLNDIYDARGFGLSTALNIGSGSVGFADGNSFEGRGGNDQIIGNGSTRIDYQGAAVGVNVDLARGTAFAMGDTNAEAAKSVGFDSFSGVFRVRGSGFADLLTGGSEGRAFGSTLKEVFQPGAGNDTVDGKDGWDDVYYGDGGSRGVVIDLTITNGPQVTEDGFGGKDTLIGIEHITGTEFADSITGSRDNAGLIGLNESFSGGRGNDTLDGGDAGYDETVYGADPAGVTVNLAEGTATDGWGNTDRLISIEGVEGSNFDDNIVGNSGDNRLDGRGGNDTLDGGAGQDWAEFNNATGGEGIQVDLAAGRATGGQGTDTLIGIEHVQATVYADRLSGSDAANILQGMAGDDSIEGGGGNDTLLGGEGNDHLHGNAGNDSIDGGSGSDVVFYERTEVTTGINANLATGVVSNDGQGGQDTLVNVENIHGSYHGDTITLGNSNGYVFSRAGNDTLTGGSGDQNFIPGSGNDSIDGGDGRDGVSYFDDGYDTASSTARSNGVTVNLATGTATDNWGNTDTLRNIENVTGSQGADSLTGSSQNNWIDAGAGNDTILAGDGDDGLKGGQGNDEISGGNGWDRAYFDGPSTDYSINYSGPNGTVIVTDSVAGRDGTDTLSGIEQLVFTDLTLSTSRNTTVTGTAGADLLEGTAGNNLIDGKEDNDTLLGLAGADTLIGGRGNDSLDGGQIKDNVLYTDGNTASYASATAAVNVNLQTGSATDGLGGTDTLVNINILVGSAFNDVLIGTAGIDRLENFFGGKGNDTIDGGALSPTANGIEANQLIYWEPNNNEVSSGITVDLQAGTASSTYYGNDVVKNIQSVQGTRFNDVILGDDDNYLEVFFPIHGNDTIDGRGGPNNNVAYYQAVGPINGNLAQGWVKKMPISGDTPLGVDTIANIQGLRGGNYDDLLVGGHVANDGFERFLGNKGNDTIDGGTGYDRADYHNSPAPVTVQLGGEGEGRASDGFGTQDVLRNIEAVSGTAFDDTLLGSDVGTLESFEGLWGNDTIDGRGGVDRLDLRRSGTGVTVVLGVNGADGYALDGMADLITGQVSRDVLRGIEYVRGSIYADAITGNEQANRLEGQDGKDSLSGGDGQDTLIGGAENDTLVGGDGEDTAVFSGARANYTFSYASGAGSITGTDGVDQLNGIEYLQFSDQRVSLIAVVDNTAPQIVGATPAPGANGVPVDANFVVRFNEVIKPGSGNLTLSYGSQQITIGANDPEVTVIGQDLIINPTGDMPSGTTFTASLSAGFVTDLAGNAASAVSGYTFTTSAEEAEAPTTEQVMLDIRNLKLKNNSADNSAEVTFDLVLADTQFNGSKISGLAIDLDYDGSLVDWSYVEGSTYIKRGDAKDSWSLIVPNLEGANTKGRIAMVAERDANNPLADDSGRIATVTLGLNKSLSSTDFFNLSFATGKTQVITENSVTSSISTGAPQSVQGGVDYQGQVATSLLGTQILSGVSFTRSDGQDGFTTGADGKASFPATSPEPVTVTPSRALSAAEQDTADNAVGLGDAISILKMIVGLNINTGNAPASAYQVVAADFNQNGTVGLDDAIGVLKHVVGLDAPSPALKFLSAGTVPAGLDMDAYNGDTGKATGWLSGKMAVDVTQTAPVQVVGVLVGDVSGDWAPALSA